VAENSPSKRALPSEKRILVVDDDDSIVTLFKTAFELEGFQVKTGRDSRNIVARSLEFKPDLIVSDLMMPAGGGYELIRSLQGDELTRSIPVMLVTGVHLDASTKDMLKMESNLALYLEKPVRPDVLVAKAHGILKTMSMDEQRKEANKDFPVNFGDVF
jgi:DNA-binding response OmpR family regulator